MFGRQFDHEGAPGKRGPFFSHRLFGQHVVGACNWSAAHSRTGAEMDMLKWSVNPHPIQEERSKRKLEPTPEWTAAALAQKRALLERSRGATPEFKRVLEQLRARELLKKIPDEVKEDFVHDFRNWIMGIGKRSDYVKAGVPLESVGQGKPLSRGRDVIKFADAITSRVMRYYAELAEMKMRGPAVGKNGRAATLEDLWMYFKYIVRNEPMDANDFALYLLDPKDRCNPGNVDATLVGNQFGIRDERANAPSLPPGAPPADPQARGKFDHEPTGTGDGPDEADEERERLEREAEERERKEEEEQRKKKKEEERRRREKEEREEQNKRKEREEQARRRKQKEEEEEERQQREREKKEDEDTIMIDALLKELDEAEKNKKKSEPERETRDEEMLEALMTGGTEPTEPVDKRDDGPAPSSSSSFSSSSSSAAAAASSAAAAIDWAEVYRKYEERREKETGRRRPVSPVLMRPAPKEPEKVAVPVEKERETEEASTREERRKPLEEKKKPSVVLEDPHRKELLLAEKPAVPIEIRVPEKEAEKEVSAVEPEKPKREERLAQRKKETTRVKIAVPVEEEEVPETRKTHAESYEKPKTEERLAQRKKETTRVKTAVPIEEEVPETRKTHAESYEKPKTEERLAARKKETTRMKITVPTEEEEVPESRKTHAESYEKPKTEERLAARKKETAEEAKEKTPVSDKVKKLVGFKLMMETDPSRAIAMRIPEQLPAALDALSSDERALFDREYALEKKKKKAEEELAESRSASSALASIGGALSSGWMSLGKMLTPKEKLPLLGYAEVPDFVARRAATPQVSRDMFARLMKLNAGDNQQMYEEGMRLFDEMRSSGARSEPAASSSSAIIKPPAAATPYLPAPTAVADKPARTTPSLPAPTAVAATLVNKPAREPAATTTASSPGILSAVAKKIASGASLASGLLSASGAGVAAQRLYDALASIDPDRPIQLQQQQEKEAEEEEEEEETASLPEWLLREEEARARPGPRFLTLEEEAKLRGAPYEYNPRAALVKPSTRRGLPLYADTRSVEERMAESREKMATRQRERTEKFFRAEPTDWDAINRRYAEAYERARKIAASRPLSVFEEAEQESARLAEEMRERQREELLSTLRRPATSEWTKWMTNERFLADFERLGSALDQSGYANAVRQSAAEEQQVGALAVMASGEPEMKESVRDLIEAHRKQAKRLSKAKRATAKTLALKSGGRLAMPVARALLDLADDEIRRGAPSVQGAIRKALQSAAAA
jgi:hypothetical protein